MCNLNLTSETGLNVAIFPPDSDRLVLYHADCHLFGSRFNMLYGPVVGTKNPKVLLPLSSPRHLFVGSTYYLFIHIAYVVNCYCGIA
jgi:hypothetical protein